MRWSELEGKEIINVRDGNRLGRLGEADLLFDPATGSLEALSFVQRRWFDQMRFRGPMIIPWSAVRQIGPEILLIDLDPSGLGDHQSTG